MSTRAPSVVFVAAGAVVVWRVIGLVLVRQLIPTLLAILGIAFLVCGLLVFRKLPGKATIPSESSLVSGKTH